MNDIEEFVSSLGTERPQFDAQQRYPDSPVPTGTAPTGSSDTTQWAVLGDNKYMTAGRTIQALIPGIYKLEVDNYGQLLFCQIKLVTDTLCRLPDSAGDRVIEGIQAFWASRERFIARGHVFKRGVLLWGPPGGGKTATTTLLMADLVERGGLVVWCDNPELTIRALDAIRRIEPERPVICVLEDLDELCRRWSEHQILALLDGENQINNVVFIGTTNYPELLDARMVNRPSRFDEVIKIGMPTAEAREVYLRSRLGEDELSDQSLERWVSDSEGFSIAHIKEMIVAVFCLNRTYDETLTRLKAMRRKPVGEQGSERVVGMSPSNGVLGKMRAY